MHAPNLSEDEISLISMAVDFGVTQVISRQH
jgi:hypothetical protein